MKSVTANDVKSFLGERFTTQLQARGVAPSELPDDLDLLEEGIIDSMGIIELVVALDDRFGISVDFEDLDPEQLTVVGPFCRYVAEMSQGR